MKMRDDSLLGPRKTIQVKASKKSSLERPEEFFVELEHFKKDNPDVVIQPTDLVWEEVEPGVWKEGDTCKNYQLYSIVSFALLSVVMIIDDVVSHLQPKKVNVRTGRAGYHRRITAMEKSVEQTAEVYNHEIDLGNNAAEKHFNMASKEVFALQSSIDVKDLLFFQASEMVTPAVSTSRSSKPIRDGEVLEQAHVSDDNADPSDNEGTEPPAPSGSFLQSLGFALPKSKVESMAKSQAKAQAKGVAKAKPKPKPDGVPKKGIKRKANDAAAADDDAKVLKLEDLANKDDTGGLDSGDQQILNEYKQKIADKRKSLFASMMDNDSGTSDCLKSGMKDLAGLQSQIKGKTKSLKRRKDGSSSSLIQDLDEIAQEAGEVHKLAHGLLSTIGEDVEHVETMARCCKSGWAFAPAMFKRAFKCAMLSHLKYEQWSSVTSTTRDLMFKHLSKEDAESFFNVLLNDMVQKLMKSIAISKVS